MLVVLSSYMIVTVEDLVCRLYFDIPSVSLRIDLILSCGCPQPPLGRLGIFNVTVAPAVSEKVCWGANSRKRLAITKNRATFLYFMELPFFNYRFYVTIQVVWFTVQGSRLFGFPSSYPHAGWRAGLNFRARPLGVSQKPDELRIRLGIESLCNSMH